MLGVLVISGEYSTGMIRSSFAAAPKRLPVLWAKLLVFGTTALLLMLPSALFSFFVAQAILRQHHVQTTFGEPHVARAVIGSALFLTVVGLLGVALGALVRNTAGGIATLAGVLFVLPGSRRSSRTAGATRSTRTCRQRGRGDHSDPPRPAPLSAWTGFGCSARIPPSPIVAAVLLVRRDA